MNTIPPIPFAIQVKRGFGILIATLLSAAIPAQFYVFKR
jgi:hypothetical protein